MSYMVKCLLIITVLYSNILISSASFLYQFLNGSLVDSWHIKYSIASKDFKGILLYCVDSDNRFLLMEIEQKVIKIYHNGGQKTINLTELCGCDPCDNTMMNIDLQSNISISCNNRNTETMNKIISKIQKNSNPYSTPMVMVNTTRTIYIRIGNMGPYLNNASNIEPPLRRQLIGCVDKFFYNDKKIVLLPEGDKVKLHCPQFCSDNICNGGLCQQMTMDNVSCDCSNVALNGPYCNRSLKSYISRESNPYSIRSYDWPIYIKMTWKSSIKKQYCLMEIINKNKSMLISTDGTNVIFDSFIVRNINNDLNFFILHINTIKLILNMNNGTLNKEFDGNGLGRINIGFSEKNMSCDIFQGEYDFYYNYSNMALPTTSISVNYGTHRISGIHKLFTLQTIAIFVAVIVVCLVLFFTVGIVWYKRSKQDLQRQIQIAISNYSLDAPSRVCPESKTYGLVSDTDTYDYIQETSIYATIND